MLDGYISRSGTTKHAAADSQSKKDRPGYDTLHKHLAGEHVRLTKGLLEDIEKFIRLAKCLVMGK